MSTAPFTIAVLRTARTSPTQLGRLGITLEEADNMIARMGNGASAADAWYCVRKYMRREVVCG